MNARNVNRSVRLAASALVVLLAAAGSARAQQYVYRAPMQARPMYYQPAYQQAYQPTYQRTAYYGQPPATYYAQPTAYAQPTQYVQPTAYAAQPQPVAAEAARPVQAAQPAAQPAPSGDPYGFTGWLNSVRAQYGLGAVGYDPNLEAWASQNNAAQNARGMGHFVMGPARRQNSAMGNYASIGAMWLASPAHAAALLDPTISFIGLAGSGAYWTFNAY